MAETTEIRSRLWEWQSVQGLIFVFCVCLGLPLLIALSWSHLTAFLVVFDLLMFTVIPLAAGLFLGLSDTPRAISSTAEMVRLTFYAWRGKDRIREYRPDQLGELKTLSFGWFGSGLTDRARWGAGGIRAISLTRRQARIFEGRVRKASWLRG